MDKFLIETNYIPELDESDEEDSDESEESLLEDS